MDLRYNPEKCICQNLDPRQALSKRTSQNLTRTLSRKTSPPNPYLEIHLSKTFPPNPYPKTYLPKTYLTKP